MRFLCILFCCIVFVTTGFSQTEELAENYVDQGEYEKAKAIYQKLYKSNPRSLTYLYGLSATLQELEEYDEAEKILQQYIKENAHHPNLLVELGYNYQLKGNQEKADDYYKQALKKVNERSNHAYAVGKTFQKYSLLNEAAETYESALQERANTNFSIQLAQVYGEQGKIEKMFSTYLNLVKERTQYFHAISRRFSEYITEDPETEANQTLRKLLLKELQKNPDILYNEMLSWLFSQQKQFDKAFVQEKAIYQRSSEKTLHQLSDLASIAAENQQIETAKEILNYVIEKAVSDREKLQAYQELMDIEVDNAKPEDYEAIEKKFVTIIEDYGKGNTTLPIQVSYARFMAFNQNKKDQALERLYSLLDNNPGRFDEARIKMVIADILVFEEQFNRALIYYSQIQNLVKNNVLAQEASFKVAKTSYYKGDFDWAQTQLKVLKTATSQLIANDALALNLLIKDNTQEDSTHTALKRFAKADLLAFQNKNKEALIILDTLLSKHKGEKIEDEAFLRKAKLYETQEEYTKAEENYLKIIEFYPDDILADDAYYFLAELYYKQLDNPRKAKENYEQLIFNFEDSIYFVDARKKYRKLRGDQAIN